jgi:hypothetical protein
MDVKKTLIVLVIICLVNVILNSMRDNVKVLIFVYHLLLGICLVIIVIVISQYPLMTNNKVGYLIVIVMVLQVIAANVLVMDLCLILILIIMIMIYVNILVQVLQTVLLMKYVMELFV